MSRKKLNKSVINVLKEDDNMLETNNNMPISDESVNVEPINEQTDNTSEEPKRVSLKEVLDSFNDYQKQLFNTLTTVCSGSAAYAMLNTNQANVVLSAFALTMTEVKKGK